VSAPLVYVSPRAARQAARLLQGRILENAVQAAIVRGDVSAGARHGYVFLDEQNLVAKIERRPGRLRERPRSWVVTSLERNRNEQEGRRNGNRAA
jgi:hypothetical protein